MRVICSSPPPLRASPPEPPGFLNLRQSVDLPGAVGESLRFDTMPSRPILQRGLTPLFSAEKKNEYQGQQERKGHDPGNLICR